MERKEKQIENYEKLSLFYICMLFSFMYSLIITGNKQNMTD